MGDDESCPVFQQNLKCLLGYQLRFGIRGGGGFIQNRDAWILQQCPGDSDLLALAAGRFHTALANFRFIPTRKFSNKILGVSSARRPARGINAVCMRVRSMVGSKVCSMLSLRINSLKHGDASLSRCDKIKLHRRLLSRE